MPTNYRSTLAIIGFGLTVFVAGLSFALYTNGPRVRFVSFDNDPTTSASTSGSAITIRFDRPLNQADYTEQVHLSPSVDFTTQTTTQAIILTLSENLRHDTTYTMTVGPDITDQTGRSMRSTYQSSFTTATPTYIYLERNYDADFSAEDGSAIAEANDHIKMKRLGGEEETLFSHPEIISFAANAEYVVIATQDGEYDTIQTLNLETGEVRREELELAGRFSNLTLSERGHVAMYTAVPNPDDIVPEAFPIFENVLESINLETGVASSPLDADFQHIRARSIQLDSFGQVALIQNLEQEFFAVSPYSDFDPILIGSRTESYGFNNNDSEIVFRENEEFLIYDIVSGETNPIATDTSRFTRGIVSRGETSFIASSAFINPSQSLIQSFAGLTDNEPIELWSSDSLVAERLQDFNVSFDGRLIAIQLNRDGCSFDQVGSNSQCRNTRTLIYDSSSNEIVEEFPGFNTVWLP